MELPKLNGGNFGGMFNGIKDKLGFADEPQQRGDYYAASEEAYDDYNEYDEFDEYTDYASYEDGAADEYSAATPATPAASASAARPSASRASYAGANESSARAGVSQEVRDSSRKIRAPKLISLEDVRSRTQVPESLRRDPLPPRKVTKPSSVVSGLGSIANIGKRDNNGEPRSAGLRSLFSSTTSTPAQDAYGETETAQPYGEAYERIDAQDAYEPAYDDAYAADSYDAGTPASSAAAEEAYAPAESASYDPYQAYESTGLGGGAQNFVPKRQLSIIAPMSYGDVEGVARALKAGDVVVLVLNRTPDALSKRVLDFSFGVASALDASVDSLAGKVFSITRDHGLTPSERTELRNQGVL